MSSKCLIIQLLDHLNHILRVETTVQIIDHNTTHSLPRDRIDSSLSLSKRVWILHSQVFSPIDQDDLQLFEFEK
jgi:hypothetical protein